MVMVEQNQGMELHTVYFRHVSTSTTRVIAVSREDQDYSKVSEP